MLTSNKDAFNSCLLSDDIWVQSVFKATGFSVHISNRKSKETLWPVWKTWLCLSVHTSSLCSRTKKLCASCKTELHIIDIFLVFILRFCEVNEWPPLWVTSLCMYSYLMGLLHKVGQELIISQVIIVEKRSRRMYKHTHGRIWYVFCFSLSNCCNTECVCFSKVRSWLPVALRRCLWSGSKEMYPRQ